MTADFQARPVYVCIVQACARLLRFVAVSPNSCSIGKNASQVSLAVQLGFGFSVLVSLKPMAI